MKLGFRTGLTDSRDSLPIATVHCFCLFNNPGKRGKKEGRGNEGEKVLFAHVWTFSARGACRVWNMLGQGWDPRVCFPPCLSVSSFGFHESWIVWVFSRPWSRESVSYSKSSACCWKASSDRLWSSLITEDGDFQPLDRKISCDVYYGIFRARVYSQNERSPKKCCLLWAPWAYKLYFAIGVWMWWKSFYLGSISSYLLSFIPITSCFHN